MMTHQIETISEEIEIMKRINRNSEIEKYNI